MRDGFGASLFLWLVIGIFFAVCCWRVYTKAGKSGWTAIIPVYNIVILMDIVGKPRWWVILYFIPLVDIVIAIIIAIELAKSFGHGGGYAAGLLLLPIIFWPMLAFGASRYRGPGGARSVHPSTPGHPAEGAQPA